MAWNKNIPNREICGQIASVEATDTDDVELSVSHKIFATEYVKQRFVYHSSNEKQVSRKSNIVGDVHVLIFHAGNKH